MSINIKTITLFMCINIISCTSVPPTPDLVVEGYKDGDKLIFTCRQGNVVLKRCENEAKECVEFCDNATLNEWTNSH